MSNIYNGFFLRSVVDCINDMESLNILSKSREQRLVMLRHAFCMVARNTTTSTVSLIGDVIDRNHATVLHSLKEAKALYDQNNPSFITAYRVIEQAFLTVSDNRLGDESVHHKLASEIMSVIKEKYKGNTTAERCIINSALDLVIKKVSIDGKLISE